MRRNFDLVRNGDVNGIKKILYGFKPDVSDLERWLLIRQNSRNT